MSALVRLASPILGAQQTDPFGPRGYVPGLGDLGFHTGQDWSAPAGTPIYAAIDGVVVRKWWDVFASTGAGAGGNMVAIQGQGVEIRYAHMLHPSPLLIGARVVAGRTIVGLVGSTGAATGPHLHFELLVNGRYVDPLPHIHVQPEPAPTPVVPVQIDEDDMKPTVHARLGEAIEEWTLAHPQIGLDMKPGWEHKVDGPVRIYRGFMVTNDKNVAKAWARMYAAGIGNETSRTNRAGYVAIQTEARRVSVEIGG